MLACRIRANLFRIFQYLHAYREKRVPNEKLRKKKNMIWQNLVLSTGAILSTYFALLPANRWSTWNILKELSNNKLSDNNLARELLENRSFLNQSQSRKF